jgi:ribosome-binding factor A
LKSSASTCFHHLSFILYLCAMESTRQQKISRLLQKDLGEIFQLMARDHLQGFLITVTKVYISPDLSIAKVYLSLFGAGDREEIFKRINKTKKEIRHQLALRVGKQMRIIPELAFFIDDSLDYIENIDNLLKA